MPQVILFGEHPKNKLKRNQTCIVFSIILLGGKETKNKQRKILQIGKLWFTEDYNSISTKTVESI